MVAKKIMESKVKFQGVDVDLAARFLAVTGGRKDL